MLKIFQVNGIYVIQDKTGYTWAATYEEEKEIEICRSCRGKEKEGSTYRAIPFYSCEGTVINVIAGPIPKEYLSKN
jgi:hypothetical protein